MKLIPSFLTCLCLALFVPLGAAELRRLDIHEYIVDGVHVLPAETVEKAVYPYAGLSRTAEDVESARVALEKAYHEAGYQAVSVQLPQQEVKDGVVYLKVIEGTVGRLRVLGSRYYDIERIKAGAPSLAEGTTPNFNEVTADIVALNQQPDRRVTPALRAGVAPGTVDIDLNVEDTLPLHGSLELNNRYSANTKPLRLNGSVSYNNLWQREHTLGLGFQIAPERLEDAKVFSGYYIARLPEVSWLSFMLQGVKQDSDVSTIGNIDVAGRGHVVSLRALISLPAKESYYHSLSLGFDYKYFEEGLSMSGATSNTPITYFPFTATYSMTHVGKGTITQGNIGTTFHMRGIGSDPDEWDAKRYKSGGSFLVLRGDLAHTHDLPADFQFFGRVQGQLASQPLLSSEQFGLGGLDTVRGYLESEVMGDNGVLFSGELRGPNFTFGGRLDEFRPHVFAEWGGAVVRSALPEQDSRFQLASIGLGGRLKFRKHFNGTLDLGFPLIERPETDVWDPHLTFRVWSEF